MRHEAVRHRHPLTLEQHVRENEARFTEIDVVLAGLKARVNILLVLGVGILGSLWGIRL